MARKRKSPSSPTPARHLVAAAHHIRKRKNIDCKEHIPKPTKKWDFYIPASSTFPTMKWNSSTNTSIVDKLREYLPAQKFKKFEKCCFGHFVNLPSLVVQHQLIRCLMVRELYHDDPKEFHVDVNGSRLRFGLQEFGVITGLRCCGSVEVPSSSQPNRLMEKYFPGCTTHVSKEELVDCVTNKRWESGCDDDFKLCILYFIHSFLYSSLSRAQINRSDFDLVESGEYENFPWGIDLFDQTIASLKDKLRNKKLSHRLAGFPLAVQIWFYECCSTVDTTIAIRFRNMHPRILCWMASSRPEYEDLAAGIFARGNNVTFKNLSLTDHELNECKKSMFPEVSPCAYDSRDIKDDGDDDFVDTPPPSRAISMLQPVNHQSEIPTTKQATPTCNHTVELQSLRKDVDKLKDDVESWKKQVTDSFDKFFSEMKSLRELISSYDPLKQRDVMEDPVQEEFFPDDADQNAAFSGVKSSDTHHDANNGEKREGFTDFERTSDTLCALTPHSTTAKRGETDDVLPIPNASVSASQLGACDDSPCTTIVAYKLAKPDEKLKRKRTLKPGTFQTSPYLNEFSSGCSSVAAAPSAAPSDPIPLPEQNPFEFYDITHDVHPALIAKFVEFRDNGLCKNRKKYMKKKEYIVPSFFLGGQKIGEKQFFLELSIPGNCWTNQFIEIVFHYLRKKYMIKRTTCALPTPTFMTVRFTTTIYAFCDEIKNLWNVYTQNGGIISVAQFSSGIVPDHINGGCIPYNESWCKVDYVLMPIYIKSRHHWVLGVLSFKSRSIAVYDSMHSRRHGSRRHDEEVLKELQPFRVLLPLFLDALGVLSDRIFHSAAWKNKQIADPFDVVLIDELPQQDNGIDCGLFVSCFAEYFTLNLPPPPIGFKAISHRERYATLLWAYASNKQALNISSDGESKRKKPL